MLLDKAVICSLPNAHPKADTGRATQFDGVQCSTINNIEMVTAKH